MTATRWSRCCPARSARSARSCSPTASASSARSSADDLRLLEALANNASVALQYDRLEQAVNKLRVLQEQLHHQAYHDPLTDLAEPRRCSWSACSEELAAGGGEVAVLFIDVDDFKTVNDSLGHAVGDALLVAVAERLRGCVRPEDIVARLGGDEFAVMIPDVGDPRATAARSRAASCEAFEPPVEAGHELVSVHLSVGIADHRRQRGAADELIRNADVAMYQAKSKGKGALRALRAADGRPRSCAATTSRRSWRRRSSASEMIVQYQPIVALETGRIVAAEALVRWEHPVRGLVPPAEFVPLAEETGLIVALGPLRAARGLPAGPPLAGRRDRRRRQPRDAREPVRRRAARPRPGRDASRRARARPASTAASS